FRGTAGDVPRDLSAAPTANRRPSRTPNEPAPTNRKVPWPAPAPRRRTATVLFLLSGRNVFSAADRTVPLAGSQLFGRPAKARHRNRTHCRRSAREETRTSGSRRSFG